MDLESEVVDDSDDSSLDIKELNDMEYDIPAVDLPSLESILWEMESNEEPFGGSSDSTSIKSYQSNTTSKCQSMLSHQQLQGISAQIQSATERVNAGSPTVIATSMKQLVAVGMSHGYVLAFDQEEKLCWCYYDKESQDQGAVSALAFNMDSTRLLIGYERGLITMIDANNAELLRKMVDSHAPRSAVLQLRFTYWNSLALSGDSSGCMFSLTFDRLLGVRKQWKSKCLFSGARGEICTFEPIVDGQEMLGTNVVVAMATLSKLIVITIRPRLRVIYTQPLPKATVDSNEPNSTNNRVPPLLAWQAPRKNDRKLLLAWGRGRDFHFTKLTIHESSIDRRFDYTPSRIRLTPLRAVRFDRFTPVSLNWLDRRHLITIDTGETLRLIDVVRDQKPCETLDLFDFALVYGSAHYKALALGVRVSEAFALAGDRACFNSVARVRDHHRSSLLILGRKSVVRIELRSFRDRLKYLARDCGRWAEAIRLAAAKSIANPRRNDADEDDVDWLLVEYAATCLDAKDDRQLDDESLMAAIDCCVQTKRIHTLCDILWEPVATHQTNRDAYLTLIAERVYDGSLTSLTPHVAQSLIDHLDRQGSNDRRLERILIDLDLNCLDLNQTLTICKRRRLYDAWIRLQTQSIGDYTSVFDEFLDDFRPDNHRLGNTMLVYVSSCLAGYAYPNGGAIPEADVSRVKGDILRTLESAHSVNSCESATYPYLRALLAYNARELFNLIELAFDETSDLFGGEIGRLQRKRLVDIVMGIVRAPQFNDCQIISLTRFVSRLLANGKLQPDETIVRQLIQTLAGVGKQQLSIRDRNDLDQTWLDLLTTMKTNCFVGEGENFKEKSTFATTKNSLETSEHLSEAMDIDRLLELTIATGCYRSVEFLYESIDRYDDILRVCYLDDPIRCQSETLDYIERHVDSAKRQIRRQFFAYFARLLRLDRRRTARIVVQHFDDAIDPLCRSLDDGDFYDFLTEIVHLESDSNSERIDLTAETAERYLRLLCESSRSDTDESAILAFLRTYRYRREIALGITTACRKPRATSYLLELDGDYAGALNMLIDCDRIESAVDLCRRAPYDDAQELWFKLLKNARLNDRLVDLFVTMLNECRRDVDILQTVAKLLSRDLHRASINHMRSSLKSIAIRKPQCGLCRLPLIAIAKRHSVTTDGVEKVAIFDCGHAFHSHCLASSPSSSDGDQVENEEICPSCRLPVAFLSTTATSTRKRRWVYEKDGDLLEKRPDLEGHF